MIPDEVLRGIGINNLTCLNDPAGSITGNLEATASSSNHHGFYDLVESVNTAAMKNQFIVHLGNSFLYHGRSTTVSAHWQALASPTVEFGQHRVGEFGAFSLAGFSESTHDFVLESIAGITDQEIGIVSEEASQPVDWERIRMLRDTSAHESEDLFEWYAQQEE